MHEGYSIDKENFEIKWHISHRKEMLPLFFNVHNLHSFKKPFEFLQHVNLWTEFLAICSHALHFLIAGKLYSTQKFLGVKQVKIREPNLDCKEDVIVILNQTEWCFFFFCCIMRPCTVLVKDDPGISKASLFFTSFFTCLSNWQLETLFTVAPFSRKSKVIWSFYVPEDCQHNLLYWLHHPELFLYRIFNV